MTDKEKLIKFAEHQGFVRDTSTELWRHPSLVGAFTLAGLAQRFQDLNVIAEIEKGLSQIQQHQYYEFDLKQVTGYGCMSIHHQNTRKIVSATAQQRFNALGRVFGLWEE